MEAAARRTLAPAPRATPAATVDSVSESFLHISLFMFGPQPHIKTFQVFSNSFESVAIFGGLKQHLKVRHDVRRVDAIA